MPLSLNQIVSRLRSLALSHDQIRTFYFGEVPEFDQQTDNIYAACFVEMLPGSIDRTLKQSTFNFRVYFVDLVHVATDTEENETEVLSDMAQVSGDFLAMLMNPVYQDDWTVAESNSLTPITEGLGDMVAGVFMEVGLSVDYLANSCQVPATDVDFDNTIDMARTRIERYTATGSEGNTLTVATLSGKHVLAAWRAGFYKRAVAVAPDSTDKIQVGTTDVGSGKGILGNGSAVLETGDAPVTGEIFDFLYYA